MTAEPLSYRAERLGCVSKALKRASYGAAFEKSEARAREAAERLVVQTQEAPRLGHWSLQLVCLELAKTAFEACLRQQGSASQVAAGRKGLALTMTLLGGHDGG